MPIHLVARVECENVSESGDVVSLDGDSTARRYLPPMWFHTQQPVVAVRVAHTSVQAVWHPQLRAVCVCVGQCLFATTV